MTRNMNLIDEKGYLVEGAGWDKDIALKLAEFQGINSLSAEHWKVLDYIRNYFEEHDRAPMIRKLVQVTGLSLGEIYSLFPLGPAQGACKIAGLRKLEGCV